VFSIVSRSSRRNECTTVEAALHQRQRIWWRLLIQAIFVTVLLGYFGLSWSPHPAPTTLAIYLALIIATMIRPVVGVYAVTLLTLVGDEAVAGWYPFAKNFSSRESISYVSDALTITPIDLMLGVTVLAWLLQSYGRHTWTFRRGALGVPMLIFGALVLFALARATVGVGDTRIAIFEGRAMLYLPVLYVLIVQLVQTRKQFRVLFAVAFSGVLLHSLLALNYYRGLPGAARSELERLTEHSASIHIAALVIILFSTFVIPGCSSRLRLLTLAAAVPTAWVFVLSQRRSGAVAFGVGVIMVVIVLARVRPRSLKIVVPLLAIVTTAYLVAFWNTSGSFGLGAQAFKSVFAGEELEQVDQSSDLYRQIEAFNLWFTIRTAPLTGVGFGNPFYQPYPLPPLSGFEFRLYIPHNSFLWVWLKLGIVGFVAMLFLTARTIQHGARHVVRIGRGNDAALMMGAVAYVVMYLVYSYVDIAWDARSMVFLAIAAAWCGDFPVAASDHDGTAPLPELATSVPTKPGV
jgi:O-antigen ligase